MLHSISLGLLLFGVWLLLSGIFEPLLLGLGVVSCLVVVLIAHRMDVIDREGHPIHLAWRIVIYWFWLALEIVKSNIDVARRILDPKLPIHPLLIRLPASQKSELGLVIYANSITLTPGTVSVQVEVGEILVHAIAEEPAEALRQGDMDRRVSAVEGPVEGPAEGPTEAGGKGGEAA
ncbi:MAG: Na+/H+ antiporter subunit E [Proteobacteria bacterium]|nr:Na+/H+ antiporter subunit E [Pseudomonadota bacterium]